jgi:hypothetical protein
MICNKCGEDKEATKKNFSYIGKNIENGGTCKVCQKARYKEWTRESGRVKYTRDRPKQLLEGRVFNRLKVISWEWNIKPSGYKEVFWICKCECGNTHKTRQADLLNNKIQSCGCYRSECGGNKGPTTMTYNEAMEVTNGGIPGRYYNRVITGANSRNIEFDITVEDMWKLLLKQNYKCALSGADIYFSKNDTTASLDRIDSSKGYIPDNIQWVHKDINRIKMDLPNDKFIELCKGIAENYNSV